MRLERQKGKELSIIIYKQHFKNYYSQFHKTTIICNIKKNDYWDKGNNKETEQEKEKVSNINQCKGDI